MFHVGTRDLFTAEELTSQQIAIVLQESQVQIAEIFYVPNFHFQFLRGIPVDNLHHNDKYKLLCPRGTQTCTLAVANIKVNGNGKVILDTHPESDQHQN